MKTRIRFCANAMSENDFLVFSGISQPDYITPETRWRWRWWRPGAQPEIVSASGDKTELHSYLDTAVSALITIKWNSAAHSFDRKII